MFIVFVHRCLARYVCFRNFLFSFSVCSPVVLCPYRFWRWCGNCFLDWNHVFMWSSKSLEKYWNSHTEKCFWNSKGCFSNFYSYFYLRLSNQWLFRVLLVGQHFNHSDTWNFLLADVPVEFFRHAFFLEHVDRFMFGFIGQFLSKENGFKLLVISK